MKSKAIFLALLALAFGARAVPVSVEQAKGVARAWARRSMAMQTLIGETVENVSYDVTSNGASFYAVKMLGGGTVFTSGETEIEPIIAYTPSSEDFSRIDRASPLWALLNKDLSRRHEVVSGAIPLTSAYVAQRLQRASANQKAWEEAETSGLDESFGVAYAASYAEPIKTGEPSDIRVSALMKTKWSQGDPYNLYTPNNYVCGCVATALAQFLRYNHGPVEDETGRGIPQNALPENKIKGFYAVDGDNNTVEGTVTGGLYAWDKMPTSPGGSSAKDEREEIGRLLFDLGIMLNMSYSAEGSGAYTFNQSHVLVDHFGYKQAAYLEPISISENDTSMLEGGFFSNFDAGSPVLMSIPGHAIVGDGYGYEGDVPYVHLNFGWAGQDDFWYNLPDMTAAGAKYNVVDGINLNCFANDGGITEAGQILAAALTGRVLDEDGFPVVGCVVSVCNHETGAVATNVVSGANGVWAAILPEGKYDLSARTDDGQWMAEADEVPLSPPTTSESMFTQVIGGEKDRLIFASDAGNSWGNDLVLEHPSVRIGDAVFSSLDKAIAYGHRLSETSEVQVAVTMEIIDNTFLKKAQEIDFDCTIVATNDDPSASTVDRGVYRRALATLTVTNGVTVTLRNVAFTAAEAASATNATVPVISVRKDSTVAVAGVVEFGVPYDAVAVFAEAADGLALAGPIKSGFNLACPAAKEVGERFGSVLCADSPAVSASAARIANAFDPYGEVRGQVVKDAGTGPSHLVWTDAAQIPLEDAVGYYVDAEGVTNTRARVDRLFEKFAVACTNGTLDAKELVVLRSGALAHPFTVGDDVTIRGEGEGLEIDCTAADGFTVTNGLLTVDGLAFTGYRGNALFLVKGGDLTLTNAVIDGAVGTNKWSGAVAIVKAGSTASLLAGTVIRNCEASGKYALNMNALKAYGGGVYVGYGATNVLDGCTITNCTASTAGGGIYVELGAAAVAGGTVRLAGETVVRDNFSGTQGMVDDLHVRGKKGTALVIDGWLSGAGTVGVKYGSSDGDGNGTNDVFATLSESLLLPDETRIGALFNDTDSALEAVVTNGAELVWVARSTWKGKDEPFAGALVCVSNCAERTVNYYRNVEDAFGEITGDSVVTLLKSDLPAVSFWGSLEVKHAVTLRAEDPSDETTPYGLCRAGDCSIRVVSGGSLMIADCYVYGCELKREDGEVRIYDAWRTAPLLLVDGGELTLEAGAGVGDAFGIGSRSANAVTVWKGGTFTMLSGSEIFDSENTHDEPGTEHGWGGGLLVDGSTACLKGGSIWYCNAVAGGGVFIGNESTVYVSGDLYVGDNINLAFYDTDCVSYWNDLVVSEDSALVLDGPFDGSVGYAEGINRNREVFGEVGTNVVDLEQAAADATNFWHNVTHVRGVLATSLSGKSLLVWADAFVQSGSTFAYTNGEGEVFYAAGNRLPPPAENVDPVPPATNDYPVVVKGLVYNGEAQKGVLEGDGYELYGNVATNAGRYVATAVLADDGRVWPDGSRGETRIDWIIAKATNDMSRVKFENKTFSYDGNAHSIYVSGVPAGVEVTYEGNGQTAVGVHMVTAKFANRNPDNYADLAITELTAKLTITGEDPTPPEPPPGPGERIPAKPIAFKSIERVSETEWKLVVTNVVPYCSYRLLSTEDLTKGFTSTGDWMKAAANAPAAWTTNVVTEGGARFWKAEGKDGEQPAE